MYERIYYETIRDTGIDPVVAGLGPEGVEESGTVAALAPAKGSGAAGRKRAPRKATAAKAAKAAPARVAATG